MVTKSNDPQSSGSKIELSHGKIQTLSSARDVQLLAPIKILIGSYSKFFAILGQQYLFHTLYDWSCS